MKKRLLVTFAVTLTFSVMALAVTPSTVIHAGSLAQGTNTEKITYGKISEGDIDTLKTIFDADFYAKDNPQVVEQIGDNPEVLFKHWIEYGIFEGRTGSSLFDPSAYASAYPDLKEAFGNDIVAYYKHYITSSAAEERTIFTIADCAVNNIKVTSLVDSDIVITPQVYWVAQYLGTNDYSNVSGHIAAVQETGAPAQLAGSNGTTYTLSVGEDGILRVWVNKARTDYGAYNMRGIKTETGSYKPLLVAGNHVSTNGIFLGDFRLLVYGTTEEYDQGTATWVKMDGWNNTNVSASSNDENANIYERSDDSSCYSEITNLDPNGSEDTEYTIDINFTPTYTDGVITNLEISTTETSDTLEEPIVNTFDVDTSNTHRD